MYDAQMTRAVNRIADIAAITTYWLNCESKSKTPYAITGGTYLDSLQCPRHVCGRSGSGNHIEDKSRKQIDWGKCSSIVVDISHGHTREVSNHIFS